MDKKQAEEWIASLDQINTGTYRQILLMDKTGIPKLLNYKNLTEMVKAEFKGWKKYAVSDRRKIVMELTEEGYSQHKIAAVLGVTQPTVHNDLNSDKNLSKKENSSKEESNGSDKNLSAAIQRKQVGHPE